MKYKKIVKASAAFALAMSILTNSVGNMFAQQEEQIEEVTTEGYETDVEGREEIKIAEKEDNSLEIEASLIEKKEEVLDQEEQSAMYTLSKSKFYNIHATYPDDPSIGRGYHTVKFTDEPLPAGVTAVDLSENGDGSVLGGIEDEDTNQAKLIVTTNTPGEKVKFPRDSSYLFAKFFQDNPDAGVSGLTRSVMDLSNVDTSEVTNMEGMFAKITNLKYLDLRSFNTSNVTRMSQMFQGCYSLREINLSSFDTSQVSTMTQMFAGCNGLATLNISNFNTQKVRYMKEMFLGCSSLTNFDLRNFDTSQVSDMTGMFRNCSSLTTLDLRNFDVSMNLFTREMFEGCSSLTSLDLSNFNTRNVINMQAMFFQCTSLKSLNLSGDFTTENVKYMTAMFAECTALEELDLSNFNTSNVINMQGMFRMCTSLKNLDLSSFNTSSVNDMSYMFKDCSTLEELNLSHFDTSKSKDMSNMFSNCSSLRELNLSSFNTVEVTNMGAMFQDCTRLVTLDLSNFSTPNTIYMNNMFDNCSSLRELNLSSFNTVEVINMAEMFQDCTALITLDLSNFNSLKTTNMNNMFKNCSSLTTIYAEEWDTSQVTNDTDMFLGCEQVIGKSEYAITTPFDPNRIGKEAATPNNGYFTVPNLEEWNATVKLVNEDDQVLATKDFLTTNRKPEITTEKLNEFMPNGYELVDENSSLTVTQDGQVFEVEIRKIQWMLELEYQTEDGTVVKTEAIQVTQLNPVVAAQVITEKVPTGYELVDAATDWTATANGEKKIIQVREIQWIVNLEYQTVDGTVVETEAIQVIQLNPVVPAQTITEKVPTGYELAEEVSDWTANSNGDKKVIQVRPIEWIVNLEYQTVEGTVVKTEAIQVTQPSPVVTVHMITEKIPTGYELAEEVTDWTATANGEKKVIQVREVKWTVNLEYQTIDGNVVKTEVIQVTQLNPVVPAQVITEKVPTGYELAEEVTDWTATVNGDKRVIQVRAIEWIVNLEYQTVDGAVVKTEIVQITQPNPVVTAQTIAEKVPTGYELVDPATDWTATANGEKKIIQVREIQWIVNLEYQTLDGTVVKTEAIQVTQLNPVVPAQTITEKVPTGYELAEEVTDWTATANGDKKIIQVRGIEWTVSLEYQTEDGTVIKEEQIQVMQLNPVVSAQTITEKVPTGYELVDLATDWTATANGDRKVIQVREVKWTVSLKYQTEDGTVIKEEQIQVTQLNPVVSAQTITEKVPTGYELVDLASDWAATANGDKKVIQVCEVEWTVSLEYQTENGAVIKEEQIQVMQLNPVVSSQTIIDKTPIGYELVDPTNDWTATANGDKKVIQVRAIEWTVSLEYQTVDGTVVKEEQIQVTQLNPVVTTQVITEKVPTGYELAEEVSDWTATSNGEKKTIQVRKIQWTVSLEYQTADGTAVKEEQIQVTQLNPVVGAQTITEKVPTGYELVAPASDWTATANGDKKVIQVREIQWVVELEYQTADGVVIKEEQIQVTQLNPVVSSQTIIDKTPIGYELVDPASDWTAASNGDKKLIQVRAIEWAVSLEYQTEDGTIVKEDQIKVTQPNPVVSAQMIAEKVPTGYELVDPASDWIATSNGEKKIIQVREVEWTVSLEYQTADGTVVKEEPIQVTQLNPLVTAQMITDGVPTGYELVGPANDWTATMNKDKLIVKVREIEWTITIEFITENAKGIVETVTFTVGNLNPVIEAQQIIDAIPEGYYTPNEIQDLRATRDGEVFQVTVEKIEGREGIVHFADQNRITIKTEVYSVTNKDPMIRVEELEKALPIGAIPVNSLTELTVTKDKEEFIIEVVMPIEEEPGQPGVDDDTTDEVQPEGSVEGVQTGDATQMGLWTMIMGGSIGVLAYLKRKKRNI